jgi:hypothetical protein
VRPGEQRLFRVEVERKGGLDPSFRLALRRAGPKRFDLTATDPFGRTLWRIEVEDLAGRFHDDRGRWTCRFDPSASGALPRLDWGLAALDLPAVLLGRLPTGAQPGVSPPAGPFDLQDGRGRRWTGEADSVGIVRWSLETPTGSLEFRRESSGATLLDRGSATRIRWRELAAEPLAEPLRSLSDPAGEPPECFDADLP